MSNPENGEVSEEKENKSDSIEKTEDLRPCYFKYATWVTKIWSVLTLVGKAFHIRRLYMDVIYFQKLTQMLSIFANIPTRHI